MTSSVSLSIRGDVERPACLALEHEGAASPRRAGFPRLVGPSEWDCFLSVKSVDRIEVTRQPQQATAAAIALARIER
jgi:DMSO/TMAO reductase YedYZ molybdopterin-dependent catalytic subunit